MRRRSGRDDDGVASMELLAMMPILLVFAAIALQLGMLLWAITATNEAVRQGVRAISTGGDGCAAARGSLHGLDVVSCRPAGGSGLSSASLQLVVDMPMISGAQGVVPDVQITREAYLP